ncbi:CpsD/CapB family tyrosine-protein kinase [Pendulispora albinea]|uniref:CpsD/CapB family tyrosine-protein kinase n=1 Tax=Pendulispora albinea TaxID=2741071 RepID=A0ABZ2M179_9BACT
MLIDDPPRTLVLSRNEIAQAVHGAESPVRIVPAWATPPDTHVLIMLGETAPEAAAALRVIRHRLEQRRSDGMWVFGVTSPRDGEGKSTFSTQLALVLSESQRARVLLMEANFQRPTIAKILGFRVPEGHGFSTQLARKMRGSMDPWTVVALGPSLHVLAEETGAHTFPETLHSTHFQNVVGFLGRGYDYVVVDGPSILGSGDANVVENAVDGVIVVAQSAVSRGVDVREGVKQLGPRKAVGVVLWDAQHVKNNGGSRKSIAPL